jgi:hypothetical protein
MRNVFSFRCSPSRVGGTTFRPPNNGLPSQKSVETEKASVRQLFRPGLASSVSFAVAVTRRLAEHPLSFHLGRGALGLGPARAMYLGPGSHGSAQPGPFIVSQVRTAQSSLNFAQEGLRRLPWSAQPDGRPFACSPLKRNAAAHLRAQGPFVAWRRILLCSCD